MSAQISNKAATKLQAAQRHDLIMERLGEAGFLTVPEMASACSVSAWAKAEAHQIGSDVIASLTRS